MFRGQKRVFTFLTRDDAMFLVVEEKEKILGYCGLLMVLDEGDITNVAVRRDRQKEGIGNFLMQSLIRLAEERGVTTIHLEVRVGNDTAIRLYERMGFTRDGTWKGILQRPSPRMRSYDQTSVRNCVIWTGFLQILIFPEELAVLSRHTGNRNTGKQVSV